MSRCVRGSGLGWRVCPPRGYSARTGQIPRRHKNDEYAAKPPARPAFHRHEAHVEGSDTTPHTEVTKKHCVREGTARLQRRRAPTLRKPFFLLKQPRAGLFRHSHSSLRVSDTPHTEMQKSAVRREKNSLKVSRRNILFLCRRWKIPLRKLLFPIGAEVSFYGSLITSVGGGQHRICLVCGEAAALPNALGGAWPRTPFSGRSPHPLLATIGEKHEKRYQIQHAHGVR